MGTWGPKLYEDDLAEDIKNEYEDRKRRIFEICVFFY